MAAVSPQVFSQLLQARSRGDSSVLRKVTPLVYKELQKATLPQRLPSGNGGLDRRRYCTDPGKPLRSKTRGQMVSH